MPQCAKNAKILQKMESQLYISTSTFFIDKLCISSNTMNC